MEELKLLIEAVAGLPTLTLWVLVGYLIYKLAIIGSWFAVAKLLIEKLHNYLITPKFMNQKDVVDKLVIDNAFPELMVQLHRLTGKSAGGSHYIHTSSVKWLREAIDDKENKEKTMPPKSV